eukprot:COSAG01_NODE_15743_length_1304_cov_1.453942_1_plen_78_part_01
MVSQLAGPVKQQQSAAKMPERCSCELGRHAHGRAMVRAHTSRSNSRTSLWRDSRLGRSLCVRRAMSFSVCQMFELRVW